MESSLPPSPSHNFSSKNIFMKRFSFSRETATLKILYMWKRGLAPFKCGLIFFVRQTDVEGSAHKVLSVSIKVKKFENPTLERRTH